ncbi:hypothetical protein JavanS732_0005 [Streptococcus satellite phage Javan732]|nr:hypothetical protein JavanS732_0005 [Streptococcus satellite phage Javan732]
MLKIFFCKKIKFCVDKWERKSYTCFVLLRERLKKKGGS